MFVAWWMARALARDVAISLPEALDHASLHSPEVRGASWQTEGARAAVLEAAGFVPEIKVSGSFVRYDQPIESVVVEPGAAELPDVDPPFDDLVDPLAEILDQVDDPLLVRPRQFATLSVSSEAPLTGFVAVIQLFRARRHQLRARRHQERSVRDRVAVEVVDAYTQALASEALVEVTDAVVAGLASTRSRTEAFESAGLAHRSDVLRAQVALREAEQSARAARRTLDLDRRRLAFVVGHPADRLIPESVAMPVPTLPSLSDTLESMSAPPDVAAAEAQIRAARAGRTARLVLLMPEIRLFTRYELFSEVGLFGVPRQFESGVQADFDFFQLGRRNATVRMATTELRRAEIGARATRARAGLEVRRAHDRFADAIESLEVAELQIEQAAENLRIVDARFAVQLVGTTDRLDAELLLARAKVEAIVARHDVVTAFADWQRQIGAPIDPAPVE